ncbi:MAG TPA: hydrolase [Bacteroidales bacterium]|nr:hydrolase [Bacteroidales bacterium]
MRLFSIFFLLALSSALFAQDYSRTVHVKYLTDQIKLDGVLDDAAWEQTENVTGFWQYFPADSVSAAHQTSLRMFYDDHTLYAGIRAEKAPGNYVISSLRRDFRGTVSDNITLWFDTFSDGTNAFLFGMTPNGVLRDVLVSGGGTALNTTWDVKWQVESKMHDDHFVLEVAIPLNSLKFREGETKWRFNCYRWNVQSSEQSALARVPQNQLFSSIAFANDLVFEKPLGKSRTPVSIIPYVNGLIQKDFISDNSSKNLHYGGDAKVAIGDAMNLDITVNPDFSNVEVDDIFTNLTRFEVFLPEKRQFFIDNSDLFGNFGSSLDAIPFFSRRIGLARDTTGSLIENRIIGGVRLSGKLSQNWRLGLLNIQTAENTGNKIPSNNNMMLALQRQVFSRSNIGFFMLNRQAFGDYDFLTPDNEFNRVLGMDFNLASPDNTWTGKFYLHKSLQPGDQKGNMSSQATLSYNTRKYNLTTDFVYIDRDFRSDLGFVPRKDVFKQGNSIRRYFYPQNSRITRHSVRFLSILYFRPSLDYKRTDHDLILSWMPEFKDLSTLDIQFSNNYIFLSAPFDPTRTKGALPLPGNKGYNFNQISADYMSSNAGLLSFTARAETGQFYNGHNFSARTAVSFRIQPWVLFSLGLNYDAIRLPDPYPDANLWLVTPKVDVTFSKSVFWSTLVQYSNQRDNLGVNSRLQWRFAPLSDLYLVYNDNYFTSDFGPKFRSINLKVTYWLNI